jgi:predicted HicB family RNase H-like nuclease
MDEDKTINIKIPSDVHKRLKILATMEGISLKDFTTKALKEYCEDREKNLSKKEAHLVGR